MQIKKYYKIKKGRKEQIRKIIRFNQLAEKVGVGRCYMSEIMNGRETSSKTLVFSICKAISSDLEIKDLFDVIEK